MSKKQNKSSKKPNNFEEDEKVDSSIVEAKSAKSKSKKSKNDSDQESVEVKVKDSNKAAKLKKKGTGRYSSDDDMPTKKPPHLDSDDEDLKPKTAVRTKKKVIKKKTEDWSGSENDDDSLDLKKLPLEDSNKLALKSKKKGKNKNKKVSSDDEIDDLASDIEETKPEMFKPDVKPAPKSGGGKKGNKKKEFSYSDLDEDEKEALSSQIPKQTDPVEEIPEMVESKKSKESKKESKMKNKELAKAKELVDHDFDNADVDDLEEHLAKTSISEAKESDKKLTHKEKKKLKKQQENDLAVETMLKKGGQGHSALDSNFTMSQAQKSGGQKAALEHAVDIKIENFTISAKGNELFVNSNLLIAHGRRYGKNMVTPN